MHKLKRKLELSVIIPEYNEEKRIGNTLNDYCKFFSEKFGKNFEILVVLNGCVDNTLGVVGGFAKKWKQVKYIDVKEAIGKGGAIVEGFKLADGELIGFVDADNSTDIYAFYDLVEKIDDYDGIIASRWIKGAVVEPKQSLGRRIASRGFNFLVRFLFGINIKDTQCGAKLFKRKAVKEVVDNLGITKWAFDVDLLYLMSKNKCKIYEIPTVWKDVSGSHLHLKRHIKEMFLSVIRLRLIYLRFRFIVKIYDLISKI